MKVKLWRRAFAASMSAVMLLGLTACGGSNESSDGIKTFTMFTAMPGSEINDDNDVMNIIAEKTGAKLKETWLTGQTDAEAIGTIIAGGEYPDFINGGDAMMSLYDAGVLVPWDDYLEKYPNLKEMYTDEEWDNFRQEDGKIYWANVFQNTYGEDRATTHNDEAFWIQARVLEWAGYPEIKTLDQYFDLLESYADANPTMANGTKNIPYTALCEDWRYFCIENAPQFLDGYPNDGSVIVDKDTMQVVDYNTTPTAKRYFQKLNEEYQKGYVDVEFATQTYDEYIAKLSTGAVLGMCDQWWDFAYNVNDVFKQQGIGLLFLIFFSGMDILGALYSSRLPDLLAYDAMHLEWWTNDFQFSSLTTCLFWVFNQTVGAWLATVCFLQEKDCRNYLLLGTACLMCGPFPFVGLVIFMVVRGIVLLAQRQKGVLQSAFSPTNVLVLVVVLSITASYFLANNAFGYSVLGETVAGNQAAQQTFGQNVLTSLQKGMLVFYLLDAGIYLLLLWRQNRRSWLFYTCAVSLFIIPFFKVGQGCDFCMRVSIPAIFILMTLCARYFIALVGTKWRDGTLAQHAVTILLAATLLIGACTPAMEIYRGICHIAKEGTFCLENEEPYTLADRPVSLNFETQNCENKLFFTYFAK